MLNRYLYRFCFLSLALGFVVSCSNVNENSANTAADNAKRTKVDTFDINKPLDIVVTQYGGNHEYALIIGCDSAKVDEEYNAMRPEVDNFDKRWEIRRYVLSPLAMKRILTFIEDNCTPSNGELPQGAIYYNIGSASQKPLNNSGCKVESEELGVKYFGAFVAWMKKSAYSGEYKFLIEDIQASFVEGKGLPGRKELFEGLKKQK